ncbi:MAG: LysR family transcriptional regulator [Proteobacteria bacterium]|nr:LysR family transcriptional regulator [Pseudomonadota bacterium]
MDIKQLKVFSTAASCGSFSRASVALSIAQPALSRYVKALETELGVKLFYRNGRGIILTEAGKMLEKHAKGILEQAARASSEIGALQTSPHGSVAIGMPPSVGAVLTVPLVEHYREQYPQIAMRVVEGFSGHVLEWLLTGKIDVAVLYNAPATSNVLSEPLLRDELVLLGAMKDPSKLPPGSVQAKVLAEIPMILPSRPHGLRVLIDQVFGKAGIKPNIIIEIDAMPSTLNLVEKGVGYTILSFSTVHHLVKAGRIKCFTIVRPQLTRQLLLATSSQRPMTVATRALTKMIATQVRELARDGRWNPR